MQDGSYIKKVIVSKKNMTQNSSNLKISLVIPAYNEELYLPECLEKAIKYSDGKFYEIIVVNNNSTDRTKEVALKFPGVRVVDEPIKGLTKARQKGLDEARGDYLAYIDADTRLHPMWFNIVEKFFRKNPEAVSLSGPYRYYDGSKIKNFFMHMVWWVNAPIGYMLAGYMILGGNFVAKKKALLEIGGFDKSIQFYGEDTDLSRRLSKLGKVVFKMNFFIFSSSRRFQKEGLIRTNIVYALNFVWEVLFKRPFTKSYNDCRLEPTIDEKVIRESEKRGAELKAWIVSGLFTLAFIFALVFEQFDWHRVIPLIIFYAIFVFNTFFSIRSFSRLAPANNLMHNLFDLLLVFLFMMMAFSINNATYFIFFNLLIFAISSIKYTMLLGNLEYDVILKRKILIDILGVFSTGIVIGGILAGYVMWSIWSWVILFFVTNIVLFILWPFYRLDPKKECL